MNIWNCKFSDMLSAVDSNKILPKIQHLNILFNICAAKFKLIMSQKHFFRYNFAENSKLLICLISFYLNNILIYVAIMQL